MRSALIAVFTFLLVYVIPTNGQQSSLALAQSSQPVQKDATAVAILGRMIAATGWTATNFPRDVTVQANVTRYSGEVLDGTNVIGATFKLKGALEARIEFSEHGQTSTTIIHDKAGVIFAPDGSKQVLPVQSAIRLRPNSAPLLTDLIQISDPPAA